MEESIDCGVNILVKIKKKKKNETPICLKFIGIIVLSVTAHFDQQQQQQQQQNKKYWADELVHSKKKLRGCTVLPIAAQVERLSINGILSGA